MSKVKNQKVTHYVRYKQQKTGRWTWRLYSCNKDIVLCRSESSYATCHGAERAVKSAFKGLRAVVDHPVTVNE